MTRGGSRAAAKPSERERRNTRSDGPVVEEGEGAGAPVVAHPGYEKTQTRSRSGISLSKRTHEEDNVDDRVPPRGPQRGKPSKPVVVTTDTSKKGSIAQPEEWPGWDNLEDNEDTRRRMMTWLGMPGPIETRNGGGWDPEVEGEANHGDGEDNGGEDKRADEGVEEDKATLETRKRTRSKVKSSSKEGSKEVDFDDDGLSDDSEVNGLNSAAYSDFLGGLDKEEAEEAEEDERRSRKAQKGKSALSSGDDLDMGTDPSWGRSRGGGARYGSDGRYEEYRRGLGKGDWKNWNREREDFHARQGDRLGVESGEGSRWNGTRKGQDFRDFSAFRVPYSSTFGGDPRQRGGMEADDDDYDGWNGGYYDRKGHGHVGKARQRGGMEGDGDEYAGWYGGYLDGKGRGHDGKGRGDDGKGRGYDDRDRSYYGRGRGYGGGDGGYDGRGGGGYGVEGGRSEWKSGPMGSTGRSRGKGEDSWNGGGGYDWNGERGAMGGRWNPGTGAGSRPEGQSEVAPWVQEQGAYQQKMIQQFEEANALRQESLEKKNPASELSSDTLGSRAYRIQATYLIEAPIGAVIPGVHDIGYASKVAHVFKSHTHNYKAFGVKFPVTHPLVEALCAGKLSLVALSEFLPWTMAEALAEEKKEGDKSLKQPFTRASTKRTSRATETVGTWSEAKPCLENLGGFMRQLFGERFAESLHELFDYIEHLNEGVDIKLSETLKLFHDALFAMEQLAGENLKVVKSRAVGLGLSLVGSPGDITRRFVQVARTPTWDRFGAPCPVVKPLATVFSGTASGGVFGEYVELRELTERACINGLMEAEQGSNSSGRKANTKRKKREAAVQEEEESEGSSDPPPQEKAGDEEGKKFSLTKNEFLALVRRVGLKNQCFKSLANDGCHIVGCVFNHAPLTVEVKKKYSDELAVITARDGGLKGERVYTKKELEEKWKRMKPSGKAGEDPPSSKARGKMPGAFRNDEVPWDVQKLVRNGKQSEHVMEQSLVDVACLDLKRPVYELVRTESKLGIPSPDLKSPLRQKATNVWKSLRRLFPECKMWPDDIVAYVVQLVVQEMEMIQVDVMSYPVKFPSECGRWMRTIASRLVESTLFMSDAIAEVFEAKSVVDLVGPYSAEAVGEIPHFMAHGGYVDLFGHRFELEDLGETIGEEQSMCVPLVMAKLAKLSPKTMLRSLRKEVDGKCRGQSEELDAVDVLYRKLQHELGCNGPKDMHVVRFLARGIFSTHRVVLVSAQENGAEVEIHNLFSPQFKDTSIVVLTREHVRLVKKVPKNLGVMKDYKLGDGAVKAFFSIARNNGVRPIHLIHPDLTKCRGEVVMTTGELVECDRCGAAVARGWQEEEEGYQLSEEWSKLGSQAERLVAQKLGQEMENSEPYKEGKLGIPQELIEYAARMEAVGGFGLSTLSRLAQDRDASYQRTVVLSCSDIRRLEVGKGEEELALRILEKAKEVTQWATKEVIRSGSEEVKERMAKHGAQIQSDCDRLVGEAGGLREAMIVLRHVKMKKGGMCLVKERVELFQGLIPDAFVGILSQMAEYGVNLLQLRPLKRSSKKNQEPYETAQLVATEVYASVLKDIAAGNAVLVSKRLATVAKLGGSLHPMGSTSKADGSARVINDARDLNEEIRQMNANEKLIDIDWVEPPPAICGPVRQVVSSVVDVAMRFPGVAVVVSTEDINNAYKTLHGNSADMGSIAARVPELRPEHEGRANAVALSSTCVFGLTNSPGWFGMAAWAIMGAMNQVGSETPYLHGSDTFGGTTHVDDSGFATPMLADRAALLRHSYNLIADVMLGDGAVNQKKSVCAEVVVFLGFELDTRAIPEKGVLGGLISVGVHKVAKLRTYVTDKLVDEVRKKRMRMSDHTHIQGVVTWMSAALPAMQYILSALIPMEAGMKVHQKMVDPVVEGGNDPKELIWGQYLEGLQLLVVMLDDGIENPAVLRGSMVRTLPLKDQLRLGIPRGWVISDASGGTGSSAMGVVDHVTRQYALDFTWSYIKKILARLKYRPDARVLIAWQEMIPILAMAMEHAEKWSGRIMIMVADNSIVVNSMRGKVSSDRVVRWCRGQLKRLELKHGFQAWAVYACSKTNGLTDYFTRQARSDSKEKVAAMVQEYHPGFVEVELVSLLSYLGETVGGTFATDVWRPSTKARGRRQMRGLGAASSHHEFRRRREHVLRSSITGSSDATYRSAGKHWVRFACQRGIPLVLTEGREGEENVVDFIVSKGLEEGYKHTSVHVMLMAAKRMTLLCGYGDPMKNMLLVSTAMKGLRNIQGGVIRKVPVTRDMLMCIERELDVRRWDHLVLLTAVVVMFLCMLRSREALRSGSVPDRKQCLRMRMLTFYCQGRVVTGNEVQDADMVTLTLDYSKKDQNGQGQVVSFGGAKGNPLCGLSLLKKMQGMNPAAFEEEERFVFTLRSGKVLHRDVVAEALKSAAAKMGVPRAAVSIHSLRSGGVTAMHNKGWSVDEIMRRGRWKSKCVKMYIWDGTLRDQEVANQMLESSVSLIAPLAYHRRHGGLPGGGGVVGGN